MLYKKFDVAQFYCTQLCSQIVDISPNIFQYDGHNLSYHTKAIQYKLDLDVTSSCNHWSADYNHEMRKAQHNYVE